MKKILFLFLMLLFVSPIAIAQSKTITAAADPYPPFVDQENPTDGLSLEIIRAAFNVQGYSVKMKFLPWTRAIANVKDGSIDIIPDKWMTEEDKNLYNFSDSYAVNEVVFIKPKGSSFEYNGINSLDKKTIGVVRGFKYSDEFNKATNFKRDDSDDILTNIKKLVSGRLDLTLEDRIVASSLLNKTDTSLLEKIEFTKRALTVNKLYIATGKSNKRATEIITAFNKGLAVIKANGVYASIMKKYGIK